MKCQVRFAGICPPKQMIAGRRQIQAVRRNRIRQSHNRPAPVAGLIVAIAIFILLEFPRVRDMPLRFAVPSGVI
jgi:hypothetical protein